jgi:TolA-binding protein
MIQNKLSVILIFVFALFLNQSFVKAQIPDSASRKDLPSSNASKLFREGYELTQQKKYREAAQVFEK